MRKILLLLFITIICANTTAQTKAMLQLERRIYALNNAFKYDSSKYLLKTYLNNATATNDDKFYIYLYLSTTHKRVFDYENVSKYLDSANAYGTKTTEPIFYLHKYQFQKCLMLFDIQHYDESDSLMHLMQKDNYADLDDEEAGLIYMQEAYLSYLNKDYKNAAIDYDSALLITSEVSPDNLPIIYGKKIVLFAAMHNIKAMQDAYNRGMRNAKNSGILKYVSYLNESMYQGYEKLGDYKNAFKYYAIMDSANTVYRSNEFAFKMQELEKKFDEDKLTKQIELNKKEIKIKQTTIFFLIVSIVLLFALAFAYLLWQKQAKLKKQQKLYLHYSNEMFIHSEEEKRRVAIDLHDSINHELLYLKSIEEHSTQTKANIDDIINGVRNISRNLSPVMFEKLGLKLSLENLFIRFQQQHKFIINQHIEYTYNLNINAELHLFRIVQEALNNVIKYANAHAVYVELIHHKTHVSLCIKDSGCGFNIKETLANNTSFGLHNIKFRTDMLEGNFEITSSNKGTIIQIKIPVKNES